MRGSAVANTHRGWLLPREHAAAEEGAIAEHASGWPPPRSVPQGSRRRGARGRDAAADDREEAALVASAGRSPSSTERGGRRRARIEEVADERGVWRATIAYAPHTSQDRGATGAGSRPPQAPRRRPPQVPRIHHRPRTLVDTYSGLRIKNMPVSPLEIADRFSDIRFVRISAFQNLAGGDTFSGCWATAGVVLDKGTTRKSAQGSDYSIWKMGALDDSEVSVFLFGDAHTHYSGGAVGDVFALFNGNVRIDKGGKGFSVSVNSVGQMMKMGVSADFSICKGKRKDGMACTMATNKRKGSYCKFHSSNTSSQKYSTGRVELKGGLE